MPLAIFQAEDKDRQVFPHAQKSKIADWIAEVLLLLSHTKREANPVPSVPASLDSPKIFDPSQAGRH